MASFKLLNLLAVSALALFVCTFTSTPVDALSVDYAVSRHASRGHEMIAKRKRNSVSRRCKSRPAPSNATSIAAPTHVTTSKVSSSTHVTTSKVSPTTTKTSVAAATKLATSAAPATSSPSSSSSGTASNKACIAWPNGDAESLTPWKTSFTSLLYSWSPDKPSQSDSLGFRFMPMLWGTDQTTDFSNLVVEGYANLAAGMNEPNQDGQSNIDYQTGINLWNQYLKPLKSKGYQLVSPAVSSADSGKTWMANFMANCNDCGVDYIAVHYYGTSTDDFKSYVQYWWDTYHLPILVTEFACEDFSGDNNQCTESQVWSFMETMLQWFDETSYVEYYCAFGIMQNMQGVNTLDQLMGSNNLPNDLGYYYIGSH